MKEHSRDSALLLARTLEDKRGLDILLLDVSHMTVITDYFLICSGRSMLNVRTMAEELERIAFEAAGLRPLRRDGAQEARWIVLDYNSVIVHIFLESEREFYHLERLWMDGSNSVDFRG